MKLSKIPAVVAAACMLMAPVAATAGTKAGNSLPAGSLAAVKPATTGVTERRSASVEEAEGLFGAPIFAALAALFLATVVVVVSTGDKSEGT